MRHAGARSPLTECVRICHGLGECLLHWRIYLRQEQGFLDDPLEHATARCRCPAGLCTPKVHLPVECQEMNAGGMVLTNIGSLKAPASAEALVVGPARFMNCSGEPTSMYFQKSRPAAVSAGCASAQGTAPERSAGSRPPQAGINSCPCRMTNSLQTVQAVPQLKGHREGWRSISQHSRRHPV